MRTTVLIGLSLMMFCGCEVIEDTWNRLLAYGTRKLPENVEEKNLEEEFLQLSQKVRDALIAINDVRDVRMELVDELIAQEMYGMAIPHLEELLFQTPENARIHYLYAVSMAKITKNIDATAFPSEKITFHYDQAHTLAPMNYLYGYGYAVYLIYEEQEYEKVLAICERLISINSGDPRGYFLLGATHYSLGDFSAAIDAYERILSLRNASDEQKEQAQENINNIRIRQ